MKYLGLFLIFVISIQYIILSLRICLRRANIIISPLATAYLLKVTLAGQIASKRISLVTARVVATTVSV